ncbi:hypothetical protein NE865_14834 [Phthorimaea operculella]|nr:hypothetical protein NE865_14834 [Phthorimaea operculella]
MMSAFIRLALILLVINQVFTPCEALRGYGNRGYGKEKGYNAPDPAKPKTLGGTSPGIPNQSPTRRGLGVSAWGIVAIIITLILSGMGFYYFSICYPILCKKSRKYDMIGLPPNVV